MTPYRLTGSYPQPSELGGYIIQQVTYTEPGNDPQTYWEAWYVAPGDSSPSAVTVTINGTPTTLPWQDIIGDTIAGTTVQASATYYPGLSLPSTFGQGNAGPSGRLPSTVVSPALLILIHYFRQATLPKHEHRDQKLYQSLIMFSGVYL